MRFSKGLFLVLLLQTFSAHALTLQQGDQIRFNFDSSDFSLFSGYLGYNETAFEINFNTSGPGGHLQVGESLHFDLFENQGDLSRIDYQTLDGETVGLHSTYSAGLSWTPWKDLEGSIVLSMLLGDVDIASFNVIVDIDGTTYSADLLAAPVPIPPAFLLFLTGILPLHFLRARAKHLTG